MPRRKRQIIQIDEEKCDGCGQCVIACAEGAIQIIEGKARLISESYCDGLGACIGECPQGAITIVEREAEEFDEEAVREHLRRLGRDHVHDHHHPVEPIGCPSAQSKELEREEEADLRRSPSALTHWPVQLHLVNPRMPFFKDAELLITASCVPVAYGSFHADFLSGRKVVIACPKLDDPTGYIEKIAALMDDGGVSSVKVLHMEVPCCFGLLRMVEMGAKMAKRQVPVEEIVITIDGKVSDFKLS
ncbi:TPA: 4Fe-4S ferredoxin [Candidatus Poribacteria bacterium]|nr:4Fe-4S ferredoxin [Candidatus Poribacteria bacterium]